MSGIMSPVLAEIPKPPRTQNEGVSKGTTGKVEEKNSFAKVLSLTEKAAGSKGAPGKKNAGQENTTQSSSTGGEVIPLFNTVLVMPTIANPAQTAEGMNQLTMVSATENGAVLLNQQVGHDTTPILQAKISLVQSPSNPQSVEPQNITGTVMDQVKLDQPEPLRSSNTPIIQQVAEPLQDDQLMGESLKTVIPETDNTDAAPNTDRTVLNKQEIAKSVRQMVNNAPMQATVEHLLKPLSTTAAYQQAIVTSTATDLPTDEASQPQGNVNNATRITQSATPSAQLSSSADQQSQSSLLMTDQSLGESTSVENGRTNQAVSFQQILVGKTDQVAEVVSPTPPQSLPDDNNVVAQIVDHARIVKGSEMSEMVIKLKPEHLGELTLKIAVDNGVVSASFHTNNSEVRGIIEASVQQLRHEMTQQGLKVEYVGVYAGLGQPFSNGQGETNKQQSWKQQSSKKPTGDEFSEKLETLDPIRGNTTDSGVDYRI